MRFLPALLLLAAACGDNGEAPLPEVTSAASWVDPRMQWSISRILAEITDPVIAPLRRVIPPLGMIDISFIVAILLIQMLMRLLTQAMYS